MRRGRRGALVRQPVAAFQPAGRNEGRSSVPSHVAELGDQIDIVALIERDNPTWEDLSEKWRDLTHLLPYQGD